MLDHVCARRFRAVVPSRSPSYLDGVVVPSVADSFDDVFWIWKIGGYLQPRGCHVADELYLLDKKVLSTEDHTLLKYPTFRMVDFDFWFVVSDGLAPIEGTWNTPSVAQRIK